MTCIFAWNVQYSPGKTIVISIFLISHRMKIVLISWFRAIPWKNEHAYKNYIFVLLTRLYRLNGMKEMTFKHWKLFDTKIAFVFHNSNCYNNFSSNYHKNISWIRSRPKSSYFVELLKWNIDRIWSYSLCMRAHIWKRP